MKESLTLSTLDALHSVIADEKLSPDTVDELLLNLAKEIDRVKVGYESTLLLDRLYEEVMYLKTEILSEYENQ